MASTRPADLVIMALGFEPENLPEQWDADDLETTRWGTVKASFGTHETSIPGVFAVGDIVRGASLVVWAIRDGREAADSIVKYLDGAAKVAAE
ncbi:MAG: FAD-dependent oxidoreductase [Paracoccaceae bacterium]